MNRRRWIGSLVPVSTPAYSGPVHVCEDGPAGASTLVLIHGFSGSLNWYDQVVAALADTYRVVRIDLLGHGSTGGPAADAPVQAQVVDAVLERLDVTGATVVGHSFGADVAVELAERSSRIARLVVVAQAPDYSDATLPRGNAVMTVPVLAPLLHRGAHGLAVALNALVTVARRDRARGGLAALALADFRALRTPMFRVILVERRNRMVARPLDVQVRAAGKPTLVILGARDHFYGARSAARYEAAGAEVEILAESGHSPLVEHPDDTARLIRAFVGPQPAR